VESGRKPRSGPIFTRRQSSRLLYKRLRDEQKAETYSYCNDMHDALIKKDTANFGKCWRAKFDTSNKCSEVSGCVDSATIIDKFAGHFSASCCCNSHSQADNLRVECERLRGSYCGHPVTDNDLFDTEVVCRIISNIKRGKASGIEGMSVEHYSHPALNSATVLSRFTSRLLLSAGPATEHCSLHASDGWRHGDV